MLPSDQLLLIGCALINYPLGFLYLYLFPWDQVSVASPKDGSKRSIDGRVARTTRLEDSWKRHLYNVICGMTIGYFAYGFFGFLHFMGSSFYAYFLLKWLISSTVASTSDMYQKKPARTIPIVIFCVMMAHLSYCHIYRQLYNPNNVVDLTGPMMVISVKVMQFAWNVWDGLCQDKDLSPEQRKYAIHPSEFPGFLEFLGFIFYFPTFLAGPSMEFKEYDAWINQRFVEDEYHRNADYDYGSFNVTVRNTLVPSMKRLFSSALFAFFHICASIYFPTNYFKTEEFVALPTSILNLLYKSLYFYVSLQAFKAKFYFVWIIAEGACISMGFGIRPVHVSTEEKENNFNLTDAKGKETIPEVIKMVEEEVTHDMTKLNEKLVVSWDGMANVAPWKIETAMSFQTISRQWNKKTHHWLKQYVFFRVMDFARDMLPKDESSDKKQKVPRKWTHLATSLVYLCSAFWHGFYPGYYLTFLTGAALTTVDREFRTTAWPVLFKLLRKVLPGKEPLGQDPHHLMPYALAACNFGAWFASHYILYYAIIPFAVLTLGDSLYGWYGVCFSGHLILIAGYLLARACRLKGKEKTH